MSRNTSQRRGLALGAVFALIASLFGAVPAQAAATDGANIALRPVLGTTLGGMVYNEFALYAQALPGNSALTNIEYKVEVLSGNRMHLGVTTSGEAITTMDHTWTNADTENLITASPTLSMASKSVDAIVTSGVSYLTIKPYTASAEATSWSSMTIRITAWEDSVTIGDGLTTGDGVIDADEWRTTKTVTLYNIAGLPVTKAWTAPDALDAFVTASATITGVNFANLGSGKFFLAVSSSATAFNSGADSVASTSALSGATLALRGGVISSSWAVTALTESVTVSFQVRYDKTGEGSTAESGVGQLATDYQATAPAADTLSVSSAVGANVTQGGVQYTVRPNQTYTVHVTAGTNSGAVSVAAAVTVTIAGPTLVTSSKLVSIDGGSFLTAYPASGITVTTDATTGVGSFTFATSGFEDGDQITISAAVGNVTATDVTYITKVPTYTVVAGSSLLATTPGASVDLGYTVVDQWSQSSTATNQYLKVTRGGAGFAYATTVSYHAVVAGAATVPFTPTPSTATGSASVTADIVKLSNGAYLDDGTEAAVTVTVTSTPYAFGSGLAASQAASVSYFPNTVSWVAYSGTVTVSGSVVNVSGDTLVFRGATAATYSGAITLTANSSGNYSFEVAALRSGNRTITLTNGTATTTSLLVVADAGSDMGTTITWDTTAIDAGKTKVITGTLTDANGNPVNTTDVGRTAGDAGTASIAVTYTGTAGILVGTMPTETDADGHFRLPVLTSATDNGSLTITAVYMPQGSATVAAKKVTSVQTVTVGAAAASSVDAKVNAGSFKGYVAVYAKGYQGQRLSAKIGNDWVVVESLASNFERVVDFTGAGYTIAVRIYIDRVLVDTITVTTK